MQKMQQKEEHKCNPGKIATKFSNGAYRENQNIKKSYIEWPLEEDGIWVIFFFAF